MRIPRTDNARIKTRMAYSSFIRPNTRPGKLETSGGV
jgi:hypothetical protein